MKHMEHNDPFLKCMTGFIVTLLIVVCVCYHIDHVDRNHSEPVPERKYHSISFYSKVNVNE